MFQAIFGILGLELRFVGYLDEECDTVYGVRDHDVEELNLWKYTRSAKTSDLNKVDSGCMTHLQTCDALVRQPAPLP